MPNEWSTRESKLPNDTGSVKITAGFIKLTYNKTKPPGTPIRGHNVHVQCNFQGIFNGECIGPSL
jgi:hypothetical protein